MHKGHRIFSSSDGSGNEAGSVPLCFAPPSRGERLELPRYLQSHQLCVMAVWHAETPGKDVSHGIMAKTVWPKDIFKHKYCSLRGTHHSDRYPNPKKSEH